jgi:hypothetical protein
MVFMHFRAADLTQIKGPVAAAHWTRRRFWFPIDLSQHPQPTSIYGSAAGPDMPAAQTKRSNSERQNARRLRVLSMA